MDAFGWSWEYVDEEMTLPRMDAISKHWERVPPLSVSVAGIAAALGVKREAKKLASKEDLMALAGSGGFSTERPEWLKTTE